MENQQQAINQIELEEKMMAAKGDQLPILYGILPFLMQRQLAAKSYFSPGCTSEEKEQYFKYVEHINENIKQLMGL